MAASPRTLAEEWTRKLLTVLHLTRQEEAKGGHLPRALDLFVKDLMGEKTPAREEAFHAGLERSVTHAVRYFDGSGKCSEISPGLSCKEVEDATHDLLEQIDALAVEESPRGDGDGEEGAHTPSRVGQRTARRKWEVGPEQGSDDASMYDAGTPEGELSSPPTGSQERRKEPNAFRHSQETEPVPPPTLLPVMHEEWPPLSSASAGPFAFPPQPTPEQTDLEMEPCAVVVYPVSPEEEGSERRARVIYPMTPVASKPAQHPPPPVPISLTLSAIMCALPMLVPGAPEDSPSRCRGGEEYDNTRPVPLARLNPRPSASEPEPAAPPTATVQEPCRSGVCTPAALMVQPDETSASHTAPQSPASAGQTAGANNHSAHSIRGLARGPKFPDGSRDTGRGIDSRQVPSQDPNTHASVTEPAAPSIAGVPNPVSPWYHYKPPPAVYPIALSPNPPATPSCTRVEQVVGADPYGEHSRGLRSAPEEGTTVSPSPPHSEPTDQAFESKVQDSPNELRHTEWNERPRSPPPQTSSTRPPSTGPGAPFMAGLAYPSARWYHPAAPQSVFPIALPLKRPVVPPCNGMEKNVCADTCSGHSRSSGLAPGKETRVSLTSPAPEPTDQACRSKGQESANDSRRKGRRDRSRPKPPHTCEDQSSTMGPVRPSMGGMTCPSAPWYHYPAPPAVYPVVISPNPRAAGPRAGIEPTVGVDTYGGYLRGPGSTLEQGMPIFPPLSPVNPASQVHYSRGPESPIPSRHMEWCDSPRPVPSPTFGLESPAMGPAAPPMAARVHPPAARWCSYPGSPAAYSGFFSADRLANHPGTSVRSTVSEDDYDGRSQDPGPTPEHCSPMSQPLSPPESPKDLRQTAWSDSPRAAQSPTCNAQSVPSGPAEPTIGGVPHAAAPSRHHSASSAVHPVVVSADRPENHSFTGAGPRGDLATFDGHPGGLAWVSEEGLPALSSPSPLKPESEECGSRGPVSPDSPRHGVWRENPRSVPPPTCNIQVPAMGPGAFSMAGVPFPGAPWCHFPAPPAVYPSVFSANGSPTYPFARVGQSVGAEAYGGHPQCLGLPPEQDSPMMVHPSRPRATSRANRHQAKGLHRPKDGASRGNDGTKDPRSKSKHGDFRAGGRRQGTKRPHRRDRLSSP